MVHISGGHLVMMTANGCDGQYCLLTNREGESDQCELLKAPDDSGGGGNSLKL